jgi:valyl-tRNA synthetase
MTEPRGMNGAPQKGSNRDPAQQVLAFCLDQVLRLWHPTIPFITERLWQQLNTIAPRRGLPGIADLATDCHLIRAPFPPEGGYPALDDPEILTIFGRLQDASRAVRDLRGQAGVSPKDKVNVTADTPAAQVGFQLHFATLAKATLMGLYKRA